MPRLSSWGLVLTRAHQQEASFPLKLSLEKQGPWGGSGRAASPVPVLWRRRQPSQVDHVLGVTYHLQLTLQGCRSQHRHRARWLGRSQRGDSSGLTGATETGLGVAGSWVTVCKAVKDKLENFSGDLSIKELT